MDTDNDGMYDTYMDCFWIIPPQDNLTTVLKVYDIDIEAAAFCSFDYLKVSLNTISHEQTNKGKKQTKKTVS